MNCCPHCFKDPLLASTVCDLAGGRVGTCDFCGTRNVSLYPLEPGGGALFEQLESLFDVFAPAGASPSNRVLACYETLEEALSVTWDLFALAKDTQLAFLKQLFGSEDWFKALLGTKVDVTPRKGDCDVAELSMFGAGDWEAFSKEIRHQSRYFTQLEHDDVFIDLLAAAQSEWPASQPLYRARLWKGSEVPQDSELYEAPASCAACGRMSVEGVPCLYIADSRETAVAEIRAGMHDKVAVAQLLPKSSFKYANLEQLDSISPFSDVDCSELVVNRRHLRKIADELAHPVRPTDGSLDYVPTQYLSELIISRGYQGIGYRSVMHAGGHNLAISCHLPDMFAITEIELVTVSGLSYSLTAA